MKKKQFFPRKRWWNFSPKLVLCMKLTVFLFLIGIFAASGKSFSQQTRFDLDYVDVTIKDVFNQIKSQSDVQFFYSNDDFDVNRKVNLKVLDASIEDVLDRILDSSNVKYKIVDNVVIISKADVTWSFDKTQQQKSLSGIVTDTSGAPLPGVTVVIKGTTNGAITDMDGNYNLGQVPVDATVIFSFIGMRTQEIPVNGQSKISVTMEEETVGIEEVVAIGYGTMKKSDLTGSVAQVKGDQLQSRTAETVAQALQGKAAGVVVMNSSGAPGAGSSIRVRGFSSNSTSASEPLYIVDGLKVSNIDYLDPNLISSLEILKDAASAAIYGAEAGNGVILITTKQGSKQDGKIFYNLNYGVTSVAHGADYMNAEEYVAYQNASGYETLMSQWDGVTDTDWLSELYKTGTFQRHTVGFEGGNEKGSVYTSISYLNNDGMYVSDRDYMKRLTFQVNASYKVKEWLEISTNNSIEKSDYQAESGSPYHQDPLSPISYPADNLPEYMQSLITAWGIDMFMKDSQGNLYSIPRYTTDSVNPFTTLYRNEDKTQKFNIRGVASANLTPIKDLVFTSRFGYRIGSEDFGYYGVPYYAAVGKQLKIDLNSKTTVRHFYNWENFANYMKSIGKHNLSLMAGMSYQESYANFTEGRTDELSNEAYNFRYLDYSTTGATDAIGGIVSENSSISYFGRFNYSYDNRYNLQVNFRADAFDSSKLSTTSRWGYFPSVSLGWTPTNEAFMQGINKEVLSSLKIRTSYGTNGNVNVLSGYAYAATMSSGDLYPINGNLITSLRPSDVLANPALQWEKSKQVDVGIDAAMLKNRLTVAIDYYDKNTTGLLVEATPTLATGATKVFKNVGKINNHGFEFELGWKDKIGDFSYGINANLATLKNEVVDLGGVARIGGSQIQGAYITYFDEGQSIWSYYGWDYLGVADDGSAIYRDVNDDKLITEADKSYFGSAIPDFTYGITLTAEYKNFDLTIFGNGTNGGQQYLTSSRPHWNRLSTYWNDSYAVKGADAKWPYPDLGDTNMLHSSMFLFNSSYFKIKQLQLGYTVPEILTKKFAIANFRAYVSLENYWTITKYPGMDPETISSNNSMGLDGGAFPVPKTLSFGCNITF
ncbi:TonB-dependent receptor [Sunxiuqinia sp. A32]|uniref:TonB-dependent receptor n=1 Tax=Sunxiuqinia sp. A32 TaxID=3461496 RepID=UPI0040451E36